MANQYEIIVAQNLRPAPSSRTFKGVAHASLANEKFTVTQNIRFAPSSRAITKIHLRLKIKILSKYVISAKYQETIKDIKVILTSISSLQPMSNDVNNIFDKAGSKGNSTIFLPSDVNDPVLSNAPCTHSWYMEVRMLSLIN